MAITKFSWQNVKLDSIDLSTKVYNFLPVTQLNSGINANTFNYFRGDNTWSAGVDYPSRDKIVFEIGASDAGAGSVAGEALISAGTNSGTVTTIQNALGTFLNFASASVAGNLTQGIKTASFTQVTYQTAPIFSSTIMFTVATDITNVRIWIGLFDSTPVASDNPLINMMAFRYATAVDGTVFWRTITSNGTATTSTITSIAIAINTKYYLKIDATNSSSILFYINNILVSTHTTNLPIASTFLGYGVLSTNITAVVRNILWMKLMVEHK